MKTLEELGISPAPWTCDHGPMVSVVYENKPIRDCASVCAMSGDFRKNDARLVAAAPDLYEALEECERKIDAIDPYCSLLEKVRDALAEAGGESEAAQ